MANPIQVTNVPATRFVNTASRYANSVVILYSEANKTTFEIYKRGTYLPSTNDKYTVITKGQEYRPDLLSRTVYGTVDYWYKLLEANGMSDILEFKAGVNIKVPGNIFF